MKSLLFFLILLSPLISFSQDLKDLSPLEITERFLGKDGFRDKNLYLCCEMKPDIESDSTLGQIIADSVSRSYELLYQDTIFAVTSVELSTSKLKQNWYFYFKRDKYWVIETMRALAMTGFAAKIVEQYENVSEDSLKKLDSLLSTKADSLISLKSDSLGEKGAAFLKNFSVLKSVKQAKLELSSDKELIEYFFKHKNSFVNLVNIFTENFEQSENGEKNFNEDAAIIKSLDSLAIHSFSFGNDFTEGKVGYCFLIGGILDNMVGFFYEPDRTKVPKMSKSGFIMIRELGNGWYLYKTT